MFDKSNRLVLENSSLETETFNLILDIITGSTLPLHELEFIRTNHSFLYDLTRFGPAQVNLSETTTNKIPKNRLSFQYTIQCIACIFIVGRSDC